MGDEPRVSLVQIGQDQEAIVIAMFELLHEWAELLQTLRRMELAAAQPEPSEGPQ
jgi:hypothetical protein